MARQYIIRKYVMAASAAEAVEKSRKVPIHEVYVDNSWLEKVRNNDFFSTEKSSIPGFGKQ